MPKKRIEETAPRRITEENVRSFLRSLGDSARQVGDSLVRMGIRAKRSCIKRCALADALAREFGTPHVMVDMEIRIGRHRTPTWTSPLGEEDVRICATDVLGRFVGQFDEGLWPELDESCTILG